MPCRKKKVASAEKPVVRTIMRTYRRPHHKDFSAELEKAWKVAEFACAHKKERISSKHVKQFGLKSAISNQIINKYSQPTIKQVHSVKLIIPNQAIRYDDKRGCVTIVPLRFTFRWKAGEPIIKISQIEIDETMIYLNVCMVRPEEFVQEEYNYVGVDLNCGRGSHIAVMACLVQSEVKMLGKQGPSIRQKYKKKRQAAQKAGNTKMCAEMSGRESKIMRDMDHKISRSIVNYAKEHNCKIVMEDLSGIRNRTQPGKKALNFLVNSWSYYRLQTFVEYKCQAAGVPFCKVDPHYTSQKCSHCGHLGERNRHSFVCGVAGCRSGGRVRHADVNAAWNIAQRGLQQHRGSAR